MIGVSFGGSPTIRTLCSTSVVISGLLSVSGLYVVKRVPFLSVPRRFGPSM
jgi:hypothetical protein